MNRNRSIEFQIGKVILEVLFACFNRTYFEENSLVLFAHYFVLKAFRLHSPSWISEEFSYEYFLIVELGFEIGKFCMSGCYNKFWKHVKETKLSYYELEVKKVKILFTVFITH